MTNVIIVHGTGGSPEGNWFPWLKSELEKLNCKVFVPKFPTPENQSIDSWLDVFKDYQRYLDKDAIVVGHSLGPLFLLGVLEKLKEPIKAAFFVAGFTGYLDRSEFDVLNMSFVTQRFDWYKIKANCKKFYVINSRDDPYVSIVEGQEIARNLDAELDVLEDAGHINAESGYTSFPLLLEKIKKEL
ncbi:MAG: alpha/beta hydrolase [Nanoarchaeota archaeon]|nr:alpha/beta hydrolase [Nanoarchaeota archaeon]